MTIKLPQTLEGTFTYVDCGAAGDNSNPLLRNFKYACYIGFDPGSSDVQVVNDRFLNFPVAVAKEAAQVNFHRTRNPNCSSVFKPNNELMNEFMEVGNYFEVLETVSMKTVTLDEYLPFQGVTDIDFIELDTQGAELGILQGAHHFLEASIIGVRVEVEFAEMYHDQPLFGDVDAYLRRFGFRLFDLERYHLRRNTYPADIDSREQIVWGQALYLRDFRSLFKDKYKLAKLAVTASHYGFHSYAIEILNCFQKNEMGLSSSEKQELEKSLAEYLFTLRSDRFIKWARFFDKPPFRKTFRRWWGGIKKLYEACRFVIDRQRYFWKD